MKDLSFRFRFLFLPFLFNDKSFLFRVNRCTTAATRAAKLSLQRGNSVGV